MDSYFIVVVAEEFSFWVFEAYFFKKRRSGKIPKARLSPKFVYFCLKFVFFPFEFFDREFA